MSAVAIDLKNSSAFANQDARILEHGTEGAGLVTRVPVSILVPIKNEVANISRCLSSVAWADQVFVVDSDSIDGSREIAEECGAVVVQFKFNGTWPKKKNWALENLPFHYE